jgi:hypothetical protein
MTYTVSPDGATLTIEGGCVIPSAPPGKILTVDTLTLDGKDGGRTVLEWDPSLVAMERIIRSLADPALIGRLRSEWPPAAIPDDFPVRLPGVGGNYL